MPIYEYRCKQCGAVFDAIRPMNAADDSIACEKCNSKDTTRLLSKCYAHNQSGSLAGQSNSCSGCAGGAHAHPADISQCLSIKRYTMKIFQGKNVLISGGSSGIGFSLAKKFTLMGANVCILARREELLKSAQKQLSDIRINDSQAITYISADVGNYKELERSLKSKIDQIDILINCAGITYPGEFVKLDIDIFEKTMQINYLGTVYLTKLVVPGMIAKRSGYIVNIASGAALIAFYGYTAYSASKYAVRGFTSCLRPELKAYGIDMSIVVPSDTATPQLEFEQSIIPEITKKINSVAGVMQPDEVADIIIRGMKRKKFMILTGLTSKLLYPFVPILEKYFYYAAVREHRKQLN